MSPRRNGRSKDLHRAWLELVDRDGPFIAIPALKRVWPQGMPQLGEPQRDALRDAKPDFDRAWDTWSKRPDEQISIEQYRGARDKWVEVVLRDVARWGDHLSWDAATLPGATPTGTSPKVTVAADGAFVRNGAVPALVLLVDPVSSLRDPSDDLWAASPIDRIDAILRASGHPIGIVTDGRWWGLVSAQQDMMAASGIVDAQTWIEEGDVRDAFFALIDVVRIAGGSEADRLPALFKESVTAAEEITVALGTQVRRAVELLVTAFSEAGLEARAHGRADPLPADRDRVYEAALTVMMRVVFLLFAEERSMMPQSALFTEGYGVSGQLDELDTRAREEGTEALDGTHHTWHRLLATSQALYSGASTEDMRLPAYGGSLFDADRFPFLLARDARGALAVTVSDRVMLEVLQSVQYAVISGERRQVSFRDIDVEQIGYIYEGLLGYTARDVGTVTVGLIGREGEEPEAPLDVLDDLANDADDAEFVAALLEWIKVDQPAAKTASASTMVKALIAGDSLEDADRALLAITRDGDLLDRLRPYVGIIRRDLRDRPAVIQPGGLVVVETPSRATSGTHYTPKSLAQEVVHYTLEPLVNDPGPHQTADESQWQPISSDRILELKIADIACGSGAFLVSAAEYLAAKLIEAWHREGAAHGSAHELGIRARRQVVANCLYGADINAMAVEMCKLSLWLVSLDPTQPFSFVDDKVLHGNSLLGITDVKQLEALHIDPSAVRRTVANTHAGVLFGSTDGWEYVEALDVAGVLRRAIEIRRRLASEIDGSDPQRSATTKRRLWREYQALMATLNTVADGIIAAGLRIDGKTGRTLNEAYENLRIAVNRAFGAGGNRDTAMLDGILEAGLTPAVKTDYERWKPLHWTLAVPDVMERGGFDAVVGNPPFLGGKKISTANGPNVREWLVNVLASGTKGGADLVAYFFLRAASLLRPGGTMGLIATNSIAQGDTREVGLDQLVGAGFDITRAVQSRPWPAASAKLDYAAVWGATAPVAELAKRECDGTSAVRISTLLEPTGRVAGPSLSLSENRGVAFQGCIVLGKGFVVNPEQAGEWIDEDPRNRSVLEPYLNGDDLNSRPDCSASRWVVNFGEREADEASRFSGPWGHVYNTVRRERSNKDASKYPRMVNEWWKFWNPRPNMRKALTGLSEMLIVTRHSKHVVPVRVSTGCVPSDATVVFATQSFEDQAVLSSAPHLYWAITRGSTLGTEVRYTPSDVFMTFPRPQGGYALEGVGRSLDETRRDLMLRRGMGLTELYNLVNEPAISGDEDRDVARLREIHVAVDEAVLAAYGWDDVRLDHGFHTYRQMRRWTVSPEARVEILDRLLEENHRRGALQGDVALLDEHEDEDGDDE